MARRCVPNEPLAWTDAHHVVHWADGGATALDNLVLLCRTHHRGVHDGQSTLSRDLTGRWRVAPARAAPRRVTAHPTPAPHPRDRPPHPCPAPA